MNPLILPTRPKALARPRDLVAGAAPAQWWKIENATADEARIDLYDAIDSWGGEPGDPENFWGGISAEGFGRALGKVTASRIALHVNSPGGDVWDGVTIMNALLQHPATVTAYVDGLAASIASVIVMGADEVEMGLGSQLMIHDASTITFGNAADMEQARALLDKVSDNIAGVYAARTGQPAADWRELMRAETWYNADEAVTAGLAARVAPVAELEQQPADDSRRWVLASYRYGGREQAPAPAALAPPQAPDPTPVEPVAVPPGSDVTATAAEVIRNAFRRKVAAES
jgi:ATP-dependent protease ClpP protease subunit